MESEKLLQQLSSSLMVVSQKMSEMMNKQEGMSKEIRVVKENQSEILDAVLGNEKYKRIGLIENDKAQDEKLKEIDEKLKEYDRLKKTVRHGFKFIIASCAAAVSAAIKNFM